MDNNFNNDNNNNSANGNKPKRQRKKRQIPRPERNKNLNFKMRMKDGVLVDRYHITRNQPNQTPNTNPNPISNFGDAISLNEISRSNLEISSQNNYYINNNYYYTRRDSAPNVNSSPSLSPHSSSNIHEILSALLAMNKSTPRLTETNNVNNNMNNINNSLNNINNRNVNNISMENSQPSNYNQSSDIPFLLNPSDNANQNQNQYKYQLFEINQNNNNNFNRDINNNSIFTNHNKDYENDILMGDNKIYEIGEENGDRRKEQEIIIDDKKQSLNQTPFSFSSTTSFSNTSNNSFSEEKSPKSNRKPIKMSLSYLLNNNDS